MTGQPVTSNPLLIMVINMTIVFGVLFLLGYVIKFIYWIDPTRKKEVIRQEECGAPASQLPAAELQAPEEDKELAAVVTAAIMAYGYKNVKIKSIQKI